MDGHHETLDGLIARTFGRRYAVLTGRGAGAISVLLKAVLKPGDKVAVPSVCCLSPVNALTSAGMHPVICDCEPIDLNISPDSVKAALSLGCRAVIAVHLFGKPYDVQAIEGLCREYGAFLIDDACQAAGTMIGGKPAGSFGDAGILSFGAGKIIPGVTGGGAVLTDNDSVYRKLQAAADNLPEKPVNFSEKEKMHRDIATAIQNASRLRLSLAASYKEVRDEFLHIFEYKPAPDTADRIRRGVVSLPAEVRARRERAMKYRSGFSNPLVCHLPIDEGQGCFRLTFLAGPEGDGGQMARCIVNELRDEGVHASQHYFPTHLLLPGSSMDAEYKCTDPALRAVNLWVDDVADDAYIAKSVEIIEKVLLMR